MTTLIMIAIIVALCLIVDLPRGPDFDWSKLGMKPKEGETEESLKVPIKVHLGLDLQGGSQLVYQADLSNIKGENQGEAMAGVRDVIERRVNLFGVSEPIIQVSGQDRLIVELAGITDIDQAIATIGETPTLEFMEEADEATGEINIERSSEGVTVEESPAENNEERPTETPRTSIRRLADKTVTGDTAATDQSVEVGDENLPELTPEELEQIKSQLLDSEGNPIDLSALQQPQFNPTGLSGKNLTRASVVFQQQGVGSPQVSLEFDDEGRKLFTEITERNIGKRVAIMIDGVIISAPMVQEKITEGNAVITGNFTIDEAKELARNLNQGALPVPISLVSRQTVGATLGQEYVQKSIVAGIIGLLAVALFMIGYYRLPGLLATLALLIYAIIALAIFKLIPVTLTLAGVAGFIMSIGMAVDANVLIFERMREELRAGRDLKVAVEVGFQGAWSSIRDSNISSIITCVILYTLGSSLVKGFALTLGIGVAVSMFSAITITRSFLRLACTKLAQKHLGWFDFPGRLSSTARLKKTKS